MQLTPISPEKSGLYSSLVLDYLNQKDFLEQFISEWPNEQGFASQLEKRNFSTEQRERLYHSLKSQYATVPFGEEVGANLELLLEDETYTVTTGQQIHIFLGPMYVYWKIISTIALCDHLKRSYPDKNFVPVFWMATEDHDYEEINHLELFNHELVWKEHEGKGLPIGRMSTAGLSELLDELNTIYANQDSWDHFAAMFKQAYTGQKNMANATRELVNHLFGEEGLLIIDPDDPSLKQAFEPIVRKELKEQFSQKAVQQTTEALSEHYSGQVHPREINLFHFDGTTRSRVVLEGDSIETLEGQPLGKLSQLDDFITKELENLNPNVVLRPLFQELILPNLAYVGGPGEIAYWLQLKGVFEAVETPFPILENRKSVFVLGNKLKGQIEKYQIQEEELFQDETSLSELVMSRAGEERVSLEPYLEELKDLKDRSIGAAASILPQRAKPMAEIFNNAEKFLKKLDKEVFDQQSSLVEKGIDKVLKVRSSLIGKGFTQERNQYIPQYLLLLDTREVVRLFKEKYVESGVVSLLSDID